DALAHRGGAPAQRNLGGDPAARRAVLTRQPQLHLSGPRALTARLPGARAHHRAVLLRVLRDDLEPAVVLHRPRADLHLDAHAVGVLAGLFEHLGAGHAGRDPLHVDHGLPALVERGVNLELVLKLHGGPPWGRADRPRPARPRSLP